MSEWAYHPECRCHHCTQIRSAGTLVGAAQGMNVDHDPAKSLLKPLPPSEREELQVSLLNALSDEIRALGVKLDARYAERLEFERNNREEWLKARTAEAARLREVNENYRVNLKWAHDTEDKSYERLTAIEERLERGASAVIQQSHQAQINKLFERQDEHKKYILEALQGLDYYQRNRFMALEEKLSIGPVTVKRKQHLRPVTRKKRKR